MKSVIIKLLPGVLALLALLTVLAPTSCGKDRGTADLATPQVTTRGSPETQSGSASQQSLDEALSELDALPMPPQANPETWLAMKARLRELLTMKYGDGKSTSKYRGYSSKDYVKPRNLHWEKDNRLINPSAYGKLVWTYVNDGDYDENGSVKIADITPIAQHSQALSL